MRKTTLALLALVLTTTTAPVTANQGKTPPTKATQAEGNYCHDPDTIAD